MTPSPQEAAVSDNITMKQCKDRPLKGDDVVISGMSGIFPKSDSVLEFMENLYNKVDMVTDEDSRWIFNHPEVPKHLGQVNGMGKFDAQFFRVHYKQACTMEPMSRKLLEHAYSAIFDSGINPLQLRGRKVGVFIGSTFSESEKTVIYETIQRNGFGITGCNKAMYANRISYWIDGKGPSYALDLACASSMACLEHAYRSISTGQCDAAIVGGCNLCMHPNVSLNLKRAGFLCLDGKTKCFDKNGDGYVRSDAISVLFLQRAKDAKRIYSQVYHAKGNYSLRPDSEFMPIRASKDIEEFLREFYSCIDVSPNEVEYVEACGSAIAKADENELDAIGKVFGKEKIVKVGSVKSNMGHSEPASGACSLTKVCIAYHKGELPANLHYNEPHNIDSIREGKVEILQEKSAFNRTFTALNSFAYTGANIHVLLKGHFKPKDQNRYKSSIPRLILASGRQESSVYKILNHLKTQPIDPEQIGLLHSIHESNIPGHMCRAYSILDTNENNKTVCLSQKADYCSEEDRPIWFVYSGMGSQWPEMGKELMRIPTFAAAIQRCHNALEPKGINIINILTEPDKAIYDNILHSFVGIAAVQIGLTDVLKELGIVPDKIIGHSVGELGCAYADGCFTAEEMILSAYSRGLVSIKTPFIRGSMAAVGLGYKTILPLCPAEIEVACHNSSESSTISGPSDVMKNFVAELTSRGIFAKEVPCSNIAYHSRYIASAGPGLLKYLSEVIKNPKPRSEKWVSTSVPEANWENSEAKFSSAEYHTNNLLNSVLFEETASHIPSNALLIEIAPHGLLQAILKRSHSKCIHVPLTRRGHNNPVQFFLEAVGKLYQEGLNPKVQNLYPQIEFPVSTETPLLSHLVGWEHSEDWPQAKYNIKDRVTATVREFVVSIHDDDYKYLSGYIRNGIPVFSEAAILILVWETLAMQKGLDYKNMPVELHDVQFYGEANIKAEVPLRLCIMIHKGNHNFEVNHDGVEIVSGTIKVKKDTDISFRKLDEIEFKESDDLIISSDDFYKILRSRGLSYNDTFHSIESVNVTHAEASVKWSNDWASFLDALIQYNTFVRKYDGVSVPKFIKKLTLDSNIQANVLGKSGPDGNTQLLNAKFSELFGIIRCAGIEIDNMVFDNKPVSESLPDVIVNKSFIPHFLIGEVDMNTAVFANLQLVAENILNNKINIAEVPGEATSKISNSIREMANLLTEVEIQIYSLKIDNEITSKDLEKFNNGNIILVQNLLSNKLNMKNLYNVITKDTFILSIEEKLVRVLPRYQYFNVITAFNVNRKLLVLLNKANNVTKENDATYIVLNQYEQFSWVTRLTNELNKTKRIVLISERQTYCGALDFVKHLSKQYPKRISLIVVDDYLAPTFNSDHKNFKEQMDKNLVVNILKKGRWGGYYYLPCSKHCNQHNVRLSNTIPGEVNSLTWIEAPTTPASSTKVQVCYAGPSFRDAQKAVGKINSESKAFGMDFSGIDSKGERVMGIISESALCSTVEADPNLLWPVPDHWTLEDAATVPLPYIHAYYCLSLWHGLYRNYTVFVNCGAGALGQALISLCLGYDCTVFTSVSNVQKKMFLLRLFPGLKEENISCSRSDSFYNNVQIGTNGVGCDFVINSLSGDLRQAAMKCIGFKGIFLDVSNSDMIDNKDFGMSYLAGERSYKAVNLSNLFKPANVNERKKLQLYLAEGLAAGIVKPISRVVYSPNNVIRAFRLLASSKNRGRTIIKMKDPTFAQNISVLPEINFSADATHVVICDESDKALTLIDRLIRKGVKNILINLKCPNKSGYFWYKVHVWRNQNVSITVTSEELETEKGCRYLLTKASKILPIHGIFITLDSKKGSFEQKNFVSKYNDTGLVVANLDLVSRNICSHLQYFVVIVPEPESLSDAYMASAVEKICASRSETALPALVLHVGKNTETDMNSNDLGTKIQSQNLPSVLSVLDISLKLNYNNVRTFNLKPNEEENYLNRIAEILGARKMEDIRQDIPLGSLTVTDVNLEEIGHILKTTYRTHFSRPALEKLTIEGIKRLGNEKSQNTKFDAGLGAFYTFIDEDECMATEPMVAMPTKLSNATEKEEELDPKETYLMLIPGFEGHHQIFKPICERVKLLAMTLQLGPDIMDSNIHDIAVNIMKFMKNRFELKSKFYLLGYSFGVNVALELAALIEKEGHTGIVYCLDSSPDALRAHLDAYIGNLSEVELQNTIVEHMYRLMAGNYSQELKEDLARLEEWNEKVEACVNRLRGLVHYSHQYKKSILESAYKRIQLARDYEPNMRLKSEIVLMKGIAHPKAGELPEDYNLSKYTECPVKIYNLESDHASAVNDCRVSNIINSLLEPKILEDFKKKNLCETYLADPFKIL